MLSQQLPRTSITLLTTLLTFLPTRTHAQVSLSTLQPIIDFSTSCTTTYDGITLSACNANDLSGIGGSGSCSPLCIAQIYSAQQLIQVACSQEQADPSSLIGHFFLGDAPNFLCGSAAGSASSSSSVTTASTSTTSTESSSTTSTSVSEQSTATTTSKSVSSTSSSSASTSTSSTSKSSSISTSTKTITTTSSTLTSSSGASTSTSASVSSASSAAAQQGLHPTGASGGGSPFDITLPASSGATAQTVQGSLRYWQTFLCPLILLMFVFELR